MVTSAGWRRKALTVLSLAVCVGLSGAAWAQGPWYSSDPDQAPTGFVQGRQSPPLRGGLLPSGRDQSQQYGVRGPNERAGFGGFFSRNRQQPAYQQPVYQPEDPYPDAQGQTVDPRTPVRYEDTISPNEMPGPMAAAVVAAPNARGSVAGGRRINFPRDRGDDVDVLKLQIFLDYHGYSVGEVDGRWGYNTERALSVYQRNNGLDASGQLDDAILSRLDSFSDSYLVMHTLTADDVKGPFGYVPRDYYQMAKLKFLPYESLLEKLAEKFHASPTLMKKLNPGMDLNQVRAGDVLLVPNVIDGIDEKRGKVAVVRVSKANKWIEAFDSAGNFMFYYPSTLGSEHDPLPIGTYQVTSVSYNPPFKLKPYLFWDHDPNEPEALLPPGPNSPVGLVWIGTSRRSVGIHGTPNPENISKNTSHGCIRLTNWDALQLAKRVSPGVRLEFVP